MTNPTNITNLLTQTANPRIGITASLPYGDARLFPLLAVGDSIQIGCFSGQVYVSCADWVGIDGYIPRDAEPYTDGPFHDPSDEECDGTLVIRLSCTRSDPELPARGKFHFARLGEEARLGRLRGRIVGIGMAIEVRVRVTPEDLALVQEATERARRGVVRP